MSNVVRGLVEGIGISNYLPENPIYFTQVSIPEILKIPLQKPDMEQLLSVMVDTEVLSVKAVDTPVSTSNEGQKLSGAKLIIELKLREKVKYVADKASQPVHAARFENIISSIFVVVPPEINGIPIQQLLLNKRVIVTPYIEDIYAKLKDKRTIFKNVTIFVDVTIRA